MEFDGDSVRARNQETRTELDRERSIAVVGESYEGERVVSDRPGGHVIAKDFDAIEINHSAVIAPKLHRQAGNTGGIGDHEHAPEIGGDQRRPVGGGELTYDRGLVAIAETEFRGAVAPADSIEQASHPIGAGLEAG